MKEFLLILAYLAIATNALADVELPIQIPSSQIQTSTNLGATLVEGVGAVSLIADRNGNQLVIHAQGPDGKVIGKAETVIGLKQTPIYVSTPSGLSKITIYWDSD